jgi:hypothetical protein
VLRGIFGSKRGEVTRGCRKLQKEKLQNLRNANRILVEIAEGKRPLGRPKCRWEDNIKMNIT